MGRISLKTAICVVFCACSAIGLSGCVEPVNLTSFVEDEDVLDIIEKGGGIVNITLDSDTGLEVGNKKITGLDPDKYYMVEEWHEDRTTFMGVQFVRANGERSENLANIGAASGGEITGLTNYHHYRVKSATPLPGDVSYNALTPPSSGIATNSGGVIALPGPADNSTIVYTLTPPSSPPSYDIVEIPVSPAGSAKPATHSPSNDIITLMGRETVIDYVFLGSISGVILTGNFYALRVASDQVSGPITPGGDANLNINVSFTLNADRTFTLNPSSVTFSHATLLAAGSKVVTVTLQNNTIFDAGSIKWTLGGVAPITWTGSVLSIDFENAANIDLLVIGRYTITIEATVGGTPYNSNLELVITL